MFVLLQDDRKFCHDRNESYSFCKFIYPLVVNQNYLLEAETIKR